MPRTSSEIRRSSNITPRVYRAPRETLVVPARRPLDFGERIELRGLLVRFALREQLAHRLRQSRLERARLQEPDLTARTLRHDPAVLRRHLREDDHFALLG